MDCFCYAQLDDDMICVGVSQLSGEVKQGNMIRLDFPDSALLGKRYNNGKWEEAGQDE